MLPAHIIDQILKREREARQDERPQPTLQLPDFYPSAASPLPTEKSDRGVLIIDI